MTKNDEELRRMDDEGHQNKRSSVFAKKIAKPKEIVTKNKSGNQDSTNNSSAHLEESPVNEALQDTTCSGHNIRG